MGLLHHIAVKVYALLNVNTVDCLTTIFLCTWVAYHPDVPNPTDGWWKTKFKTISRAIAGLLSPEVVLMSALSDHVLSRRSLRRLKKSDKGLNWTQTHASFAYMGGFELRNPGSTEGEVLYKNEFFKRVMDGEIEVPTTTENEILDKSKTDFLGKFIVVFHTLWFLVRFILSPIQVDGTSGDAGNKGTNYATLPLGLITLSLVLVNVFCYVCWWNKPANVRVPIPVYRRDPNTLESPLSKSPKSPKGEALAYRTDDANLEDPSFEKRLSQVEPLPPKGFWSRARIMCAKVVLFLLLTVSGGIVSGVNFLAILVWQGDRPAEWILWPLASAIVCVGSFILYIIFFSFIVFRESPEVVDNHAFWKLVVGVSIIVICARLCLLAIASIIGFQSTPQVPQTS